jgi:hypothetical protein
LLLAVERKMLALMGHSELPPPIPPRHNMLT